MLLAVISAVVRICGPDRPLGLLLGFVRLPFADVPRCTWVYFIIGLIAYRWNWFLRFPELKDAGMVWLGGWYAE